jgi:hypothetical protein
MTENINLSREEENLWYRKELLWIVLANSFLIRFSVSWKSQNFDTILSLWNAIFERINSSISFWLKISDRKLNESEFFNRIWTYFRFLMSIENINKRWLKIFFERIFIKSFSIIFFHLRFYSVENISNQLFCLFMFILDFLW